MSEDATLARVVGLEKVISEIKSQFQKRMDRFEALNSQIEDFILEVRASRESLLMTFPKFDGSDALGWLAQADQYFLMTKIPPSSRVDVAMLAIDGPAKPWKQLLVHRCPSLSWDRFVHELLKRFGDTNPPESRVTCNSSKYSSEDPIAAVRVAKNQPKIPPTSNDNTTAILPSLPTVTAPLLSSSPPTTALQEIPPIPTSTIHPNIDTKADNSAPLHLAVQQPIHISVLVPLPSPTNLPTTAMVTAQPRFSADSVSFLFFATMFSSCCCPPIHARGGFLSGFPIFISGRSIFLYGHAAIPSYSWPSSMVRCFGYYLKA